MDLSRRQMIQGTGAFGLAAALSQSMAGIAHAAPALQGADLETLRQRWVDQLTGASLLVPGDADFGARIAAADRAVTRDLATLSPEGASTTFDDLPFTAAASVRFAYERIAAAATQWATPGSALFGSEQVLAQCLGALATTQRLIYNPRQPEFGNWWPWEIGATRALADAMAILREHVAQEDLDAWCAAIDFYVPDPWYQFPDSRGKQLSEGANRVDLCQAIIVRAIVGGDTAKLARGIDGLSAVWQYVDSGNGFFRDGSFIQHSTIGYTGTYGVVLLRGLSRLFALLAGTSHDIDDPSRAILTDAVEGSFAPLIFQAQMMDAVRGRAVSREGARSHDDGYTAIEAILTLAQAVDADAARRWRGRCRSWIEADDHGSILDGATIVRLALVKALLASDVAPVPEDGGPRFFPAMDRLVHRGDGWAITLAMCSNRIAWYETGNGENFRGAQTSQGMNYLYLSDDDGHFDDEFWATSDLAAPPGTTVDTTPLPDAVEGQWGAATPPNEWTGGAVMDRMAIAGQHLIGPGSTGLQARKTWWCVEDMVVALGSDITTESGAEVKTVVEHRNLGTSPRRLVVDGSEIRAGSPAGLLDGPTWAHLDGVGGYLLLDAPRLRASVSTREGAWARNNTGGSDEVHQRVYATLEAVHGPAGTYAYVLLPTADEATTRGRAANPHVEVLANTADVQAARIGRTTAMNFWRAGDVERYSASGPASVIARESLGRYEIAVSDPTQQAKTLELTIRGGTFSRAWGDTDVRIEQIDGGVRLVVDVAGRGGVPAHLEVARPWGRP